MRIGVIGPVIGSLLVYAGAGQAVTVPNHEPLRIHVISDEVNPHGLSAAELTQPGDIAAALNRPELGLQLASPVQETASSCVDGALAGLAEEAVDVIVYFAHRGASDCQGAAAQAQLTSAFARLLENGGGIVAFHHGLYEDAQKGDILQLLGATASGISWNTAEGQRVFATAPEHFVTSHGVSYAGEAALEGVAPVPSGTFPYFDNIPDERYPSLSFLEEDGENRTVLFSTSSGGVRPLGYALERPGWQGRVVAYQPGEYQPNALDDLEGPNLQVLVNAIVWASGYEAGADPIGTGGAVGAGGAPLPAGGAVSSGGDAASEDGGAANVSGGVSSSGGESASGTGGSLSGATGGSWLGSGGLSAGGGSPEDEPASDSGCACRYGTEPLTLRSWASSALIALLAAGRRRTRIDGKRVGSVSS